jgi:hypothetical protein
MAQTPQLHSTSADTKPLIRGRKPSRARRRWHSSNMGTCHAMAPVSFKKVGFREAGNIDPECIPDLKQDCVLFYHPTCRQLAEKVASVSGDIELGEINWGCAATHAYKKVPCLQLACAKQVPLHVRLICVRTS